MMEAGWSARRVARQLDHSDCVVRRWIKTSGSDRCHLHEDQAHDESSRRSPHRNARVQPTASSAAIQAQVAPSLEAPVSSRTIRRRLAEGHLGSAAH
ncbi:HTH_Tnp_Tc3_2 domain-containing protein [Trichonephila clavipes]|nr:HTH_Tnp_Tc3_2 domain-containing protein [Trichonephila clavipes]